MTSHRSASCVAGPTKGSAGYNARIFCLCAVLLEDSDYCLFCPHIGRKCGSSEIKSRLRIHLIREDHPPRSLRQSSQLKHAEHLIYSQQEQSSHLSLGPYLVPLCAFQSLIWHRIQLALVVWSSTFTASSLLFLRRSIFFVASRSLPLPALVSGFGLGGGMAPGVAE